MDTTRTPTSAWLYDVVDTASVPRATILAGELDYAKAQVYPRALRIEIDWDEAEARRLAWSSLAVVVGDFHAMPDPEDMDATIDRHDPDWVFLTIQHGEHRACCVAHRVSPRV